MKRLSILLVLAILISSSFAILTVSPGVKAIDLTPTPVTVRTNTNVKDSVSLVAGDDGRIYLAWAEKITDSDIMLSYSSNNGTSFSPAARVNNNAAGTQASCDAAAADGSLYIVWNDLSQDTGNIILGRSNDSGMTFDEVHVSKFEDGTQAHPTIAAAGNRVAVAWEEYRSDNTIRLWKGINGDLVLDWETTGHQGAVRDVEFSPNGMYIASGSEDNMVKIWNAGTGSLVRNITSHTNKVLAVNWSSDGNMLATGSFDYNITIYNTTDFSEITRLNSTGGILTKNYVNAVSFSPDSGHIAAAYNGQYDNKIPTGFPSLNFNFTVWNLTDYSSWTRQHSNSVMDVAFSHNGTYVASSCKAPKNNTLTLKIWNASDGLLVNEINMGRSADALSWSPDDRFIAVGLVNGSIAIVNVSDPNDISWMKSTHTGGVHSVDWSIGDEIVSGASDPKAKIWFKESDSYYGYERVNLNGHMNSVYSVDWSSNGLSAVTAGGISTQYNMGENQIFCAVSNDNGLTFSSPTMVSDSCSRNRLRPQIGMSPIGDISVTWYDSRIGKDDIYYANLTDSDVTFRKNIGVTLGGDDEMIPQIFVDGNGVSHVVWQYGLGVEVRYANSSDNFQHAQTIATNAQLPTVTGAPDGSSLWVGWRQYNTTTKMNNTWAALSYNSGASFAENVLLNSSRRFVGPHTIFVDNYNQTSIAWEINETPNEKICYRTTVLSDLWGPSVLSTSPANGETDVSIFTTFQIRFSEPMDRVSVEAALSWTNGIEIWTIGDCEGNQGTWNAYGDAVSFEPRMPLKYDQTIGYTVTIASTATDLAGNAFASDITFSFKTSADSDPPTIDHFPSQSSVSYDQSYNVMATIIDYWGNVSSARLYYQGVSDASPINSIEMTLTDTDTYQAAIPPQLSLGFIHYYIWANDTFNNVARNPTNYTNQSQLFNVSVVDGVKPEISHVQVTEEEVFKDIEIWAVVTDEVQLQGVYLHYRAINSSIYVNVAMQPAANSTPNTYKHQIPAQGTIGQVQYNITAVDQSGNFNSTPILTIQIIDRYAPVINSVIPQHLENQTKVLIRANVTDDVGVNSVVLYFKAVGGNQWVSRSMTYIEGDYYEFTILAQRRSGMIYYYVNATDIYGNQASTLSEQDQFQIEVVGVGPDYTLYYALACVLALLMVVLVFLVVRKFSKPAQTEEPPETAESLAEEPSTLETELCPKCEFDIEKGASCPFCASENPVEPVAEPPPKPEVASPKPGLDNQEMLARLEKAFKDGKMSEEQYLRNVEKFSKR